MKTNSRKKHILFSRNDNVSANSDDNTTISENKNELVGIVLDSKLPFKDHIKNVSKEASQKLNAWVRVVPYMSHLNLGTVLQCKCFISIKTYWKKIIQFLSIIETYKL